jgi:hypothetical protein
MDSPLFPIVLILFFVLFGTVLIGGLIIAAIISRKREQERTRQFANVASLLGWQFSDAADLGWIPNLEKFALFTQGHSKSITDVMYGELNGIKAAFFDYHYVVGHGKNRSTYNQSVAYFEPRNLNLPFFSLRPERTFHKIISAFGYQDIDFGNRPDFSSRYLLRAPDEGAVRQSFNDALLGFYEMNQGTSTDGGGNQLFIFRQNSRVEPHEAQAFLNGALQLQSLYSNRW